MKGLRALALILIALAVLNPSLAAAQAEDPPLRLRLNRTFGYGGIGQIEGTFTLEITNEEEHELDRVEFVFDGEVVYVDDSAPFSFRFQTGQFSSGMHVMTAVGYTEDGPPLNATTYQREFLTQEAARNATARLLLPLLLGIGALTLIGVGLPVLLGRKGTFKPGQYGAAGGAICPRCAKPYSRHVLSPNLLAGKLERCPHCGKWAIVRRATAAELQQAEAALKGEGTSEVTSLESEADRLRRQIDDSRYE
jgi:hypothetical protein